MVKGLDAYKQSMVKFHAAVPDLHFEIDDQIAQGDQVVARWTLRGTQRGELQGHAATGKSFEISGVSTFRIAEGKIQEIWASMDRLGMQQQLGWRSAQTKHDIHDPEVARKLFDSWKAPFPPFRILGNVYYVGLSGVSSYLITTPAGHILMDTAFDDTVPLLQANIAALGFDWRDIKFILASHAHVDHTGAHARMKDLTGAVIVMSEADAALLARGGREDFSPFPAELLAYRPAQTDRIVCDDDQVTLGGVTFTAHLTPGHTQGATTWTTRLAEGGRELDVMFFSSLGLVEGTRLRDNSIYPGIVAGYRESLAKLRKLPCDIFLAPHGEMFGLADKAERLKRGEQPNPFIDTQALSAILATTERVLAEALGKNSTTKAAR